MYSPTHASTVHMISKLHYISQETAELSHLQSIEAACQAGCDWVQLRVKNTSYEEYEAMAREAMKICNRYGAKLIVNDNVCIAQKVGSHGVHLGKLDMPVAKARQILGDDFIIGGTANTFEDIVRLHQHKVDYIGLGPFRFTATKQHLSPILGLDNYFRILTQCKSCNIQTPIVAIGGITLQDVNALRQTGIYGVAVSGAITHAENKSEVVKDFLHELYHAKVTNS